eukprot:Selendium_serpulae@DN2758_c0_g1_i2.p1
MQVALGEPLLADAPPPLLLQARGSSIPASISVLSNTILGVALLGLPWCFATNGLLLGSALIVVCACLSAFGLFLLSAVAHRLLDTQHSRKVTFLTVNKILFPRFKYAVDGVILVKSLGVATSYLLVVGDVVPDMAAQLPLTAGVAAQMSPSALRTASILFVMIFLIIPASLPKRIRSTRFTNWVSVGCVAYVAVMAVVLCALNEGAVLKCQATDIMSNVSLMPQGTLPEIASTIPVFIFAFTCHQNAFSVASELKGRTMHRLVISLSSAVVLSLTLYFITALAGYIQFGHCVGADVLNSYDSSLMVVRIGKILVAVSVIFSFPLQCHPFRNSFAVVCCGNRELSEEQDRKMYRISTTVFFAATTCVALAVRNLGILFELVGVICSNTLCYIAPSILYIKMFSSPEERNVTWFCSWALLGLGLVVLPVCLGCILVANYS